MRTRQRRKVTYMFERRVRGRTGTRFFQVLAPVKADFLQAWTFFCWKTKTKETKNTRTSILEWRMEKYWPPMKTRISLTQVINEFNGFGGYCQICFHSFSLLVLETGDWRKETLKKLCWDTLTKSRVILSTLRQMRWIGLMAYLLHVSLSVWIWPLWTLHSLGRLEDKVKKTSEIK